jgi:hypothetical protein
MRTLAALIIALPALAQAYPQFQLSTGDVRCNQCHFAPAGGGLLSGYGREQSADAISMGGNGGFLHGAWDPPAWLDLGADLRVAGLYHDEDAIEGADLTAFPMQVDVYARVSQESMSAYVTAGLRGATRPKDPSLGSRLVSREHYLMWRQGSIGSYARAGRFFAPYGLRLAEHTAYVRRFLGFNVLEETYNLSAGYISDAWELHVTAFTHDFVRRYADVGQTGSGGAASYERRLGKRAAFGAQAKVTIGEYEKRSTGGLVGKLYLEGARLQLLAEADVVYQTFDDVDAPRGQLLAYLGATWFPFRGLMAQLAVERWDEDLEVKGVARSAVDAALQWFPTAHVELSLWGRIAVIGSGSDDGTPAKTVLLQIHYYL